MLRSERSRPREAGREGGGGEGQRGKGESCISYACDHFTLLDLAYSFFKRGSPIAGSGSDPARKALDTA